MDSTAGKVEKSYKRCCSTQQLFQLFVNYRRVKMKIKLVFYALVVVVVSNVSEGWRGGMPQYIFVFSVLFGAKWIELSSEK